MSSTTRKDRHVKNHARRTRVVEKSADDVNPGHRLICDRLTYTVRCTAGEIRRTVVAENWTRIASQLEPRTPWYMEPGRLELAGCDVILVMHQIFEYRVSSSVTNTVMNRVNNESIPNTNILSNRVPATKFMLLER